MIHKTGKFFRALLETEFVGQGPSERGETRDVGEEGSALGPVGQVLAGGQSLAAVHGQVDGQRLAGRYIHLINVRTQSC